MSRVGVRTRVDGPVGAAERLWYDPQRWPNFIDGFGEFTGCNASKVADEVIAALKQRGLLVARERYPHIYPHCWRTGDELVFRLVDEWFIDMDWRLNDLTGGRVE